MAVEKLLTQVRPNNTEPQFALSARSGKRVTITRIYITNVGTSEANYSIYFNANNQSFNENNAIFYDIDVSIGEATIIEPTLPLNDTLSKVGVRSTVANGLTFTFFGTEE